MKPARNQNIPCGAIIGCYWAANTVFFSYVTAFFLENGYSAFEVGIVNTVLYLVSTILGPVSGYITDSILPPRRYIILSMTLTIPFVLLIPVVFKNLIVTCLCIIAIAFFQNLLFGVIDSWIMGMRQQGIYVFYPVVRSIGSASFSIVSAVLGYIIGFTGYGIIFPLNIFFCLMIALCALFMVPIPCVNRADEDVQRIGFFKALKILCSNFQFAAFLIAIFLSYTTIRMSLIFHPNLIFHIGGTSADLGISIFLSAIFEVPVLLFAAKYFRRYDPRKLVLIALSFGALKAVLLFFAESVPLFWIAQVAQSFCVGIFQGLIVCYFRKIVPKQIYATAIMVNSAVNAGLSGMVASFFGGLMMEYSRELFLTVSIIIAVSAVVIYGLSMLKKFDNTGWYDA